MSIVLEHLTKRYGMFPVVNRVSLEVAEGEFFVLLGASGSGKSTILRMIAGLTSIDQGRVFLNGRDVTNIAPQQRSIGFVFQSYALFSHMSVGENIEFGLRVRKVPAPERRRRRDELLELVGLAGLGSRMPRQLSGGQQQRVALARALAYRPEVLLLDEPFGALDAKIRVELRRTLRRIQRELGMTTIFVTHDQDEAFELADRIGVMNVGRLLEVGPAEELYLRPQTEFVATFLGTANLLVGTAVPDGVQLGALHFPLATQARQIGDPQRVQVLFRPEDVVLASSPEALPGMALGRGEVEHSLFAGSCERLRLRLPPIAGVRPIAPPVPFGGDFVLIEAIRSQEQARHVPLQIGASVWVGVRRLHALAHPGLSFLIPSDASLASQAALAVGVRMARLANARTTVLSYGVLERKDNCAFVLDQYLQEIKEQIGGGLPLLDTRTTPDHPGIALSHEVERQHYDLVILGIQPQGDMELAEQLLQTGEHHLLLVPDARSMLARVLICVAAGEPGKDDVRFAGRLMRHLGAEATLLTILPKGGDTSQARLGAERFLGAGVRTLSLLGVPARSTVRVGEVRDEILSEMTEQNYDLLVLGAPLPNREGRSRLDGVVGELIRGDAQRPILIVRSWNALARALWVKFDGRIGIYDEVIS